MRHEHDTNPEAWREVVCEKCGKKFIPAIYHQYVDYKGNYSARRYFCSYTCYLHRQVLSEVDGRSKKQKPVQRYSKDGTFIAEYKSALDAVLALMDEGIDCDLRYIQKVCRGNCKSARGYIWKYKED